MTNKKLLTSLNLSLLSLLALVLLLLLWFI